MQRPVGFAILKQNPAQCINGIGVARDFGNRLLGNLDRAGVFQAKQHVGQIVQGLAVVGYQFQQAFIGLAGGCVVVGPGITICKHFQHGRILGVGFQPLLGQSQGRLVALLAGKATEQP